MKHLSSFITALALGGVLVCAAPSDAQNPEPLPWQDTPSAADDLAISGGFAGVPDRAKRYVRHAELLAMREVKVITEEPFARMGSHECTVLFWKDLLRHLPLKPGADCVRLRCADQWESVYRQDFIERWNPYILLLVDGKSLATVVPPPPFDKVRLAPYAMNVSAALYPGFKYAGVGSADPLKVIEITAANYGDYYKPWFSGQYSDLGREAKKGRELFLNQCSSCHEGPDGACGGHLSTQPWDYLVLVASSNGSYFKDYVRNPQKFIPGVAMPKHEAFTDETFDQLVAFLTAGSASAR